MIEHINVKTGARSELLDITSRVQEVVEESGIRSGICYLYITHTTAGITINEGADSSVKRDILKSLESLVPRDAGYTHMEGNADAHIKSSLLSCSTFVMIEDGKLVLGTWQAIFFCEFDGPRQRRVTLKIIGS